jgi:hypothetical protein
MNKFVKLQKYSDEILKDHVAVNTKDRITVVRHMALFIDAVIFNIVSMFCLIAIINNTTNITDKTIEVGMKYLESKCNYKGQSGGRSATFLGTNEPMYSVSNPTDDVLFVDFQNGLARPQIGGGPNLYKAVNTYISNLLQYHNIGATKTVKTVISDIINKHIDCLVKCLKDASKSKKITLSVFQKIVKKHKILKSVRK